MFFSQAQILGLAACLVITRLGSREKPVSGAQLSARYALPPRTFEAILQKLARAGIVQGVRGSYGGYVIPRPHTVTLADILLAIANADQRPQDARSARGRVMEELGQIIMEDLTTATEVLLAHMRFITLQDWAQRAGAKGLLTPTIGMVDFSI